MRTLVCFLEERSAKAMLLGILPRLLPGVAFRCIAFEGKQDLNRQLVRRLRGWPDPNSVFLVMQDQDFADCKDVKNRLRELSRKAGRTESETLVRIACRELESFYFGDLAAVEKGLATSH